LNFAANRTLETNKDHWSQSTNARKRSYASHPSELFLKYTPKSDGAKSFVIVAKHLAISLCPRKRLHEFDGYDKHDFQEPRRAARTK